MNAPLPPCPRTDAVLAIYLDGDAAAEASGFQFACQDSLAEHLRDCATCRLQLQRARRLDAALAEQAGRMLAAHTGAAGGLEQRAAAWFAPERLVPVGAPAIAAARPQLVAPQSVSPQSVARQSVVRRSTPLWVGPCAAALAGVGLVLAAWFAGRVDAREPVAAVPIATRPARVPAAPADAGPTAAPEAPGIRVADDAVQSATKLADARAAQPKPVFDREAELRRLGDGKLAPGVRVAAAQRLLASERPGVDGVAFAGLTEVLAAGQPGASGLAAMVAIHDAAAREAPFVAQLRSAVQRLDHPRSVPGLADFAALTVAARLDRRDLDAAVLRAVRRHAELAPVLAAALRSGIRQRGSAALLLDAWDGLAARGALRDDDRAAQLWFACQHEETFAAVRDELAAARSAPRRVRCLLALGACPDDDRNRAVLVAWTASACRDEAYAAAFALARQLGPGDRELPRLAAKAAQDRAEFLLRAALACAGLPEAEAWVAPLSLTAAERTLLTACTFAQFPAVAAWFRDPLGGPLGGPPGSHHPSGD